MGRDIAILLDQVLLPTRISARPGFDCLLVTGRTPAETPLRVDTFGPPLIVVAISRPKLATVWLMAATMAA
jgi:hypothetical protein